MNKTVVVEQNIINQNSTQQYITYKTVQSKYKKITTQET